MRRSITFILFLSIFSSFAFSQDKDKHNIKITIKGAENSFLTIGYHLGNKQYIKDTVLCDETGTGIYSGPEVLDQGLYIVLMPDNRYFDLIIDTDQHFEISCSLEDIVGTMQVSGSEENQDFIEYQRKWVAMQSESRLIRERLQKNNGNQDSLPLIRAQLSSHEAKMVSFLEVTGNQKPDSFLSLLVKALLPVRVPEFDIPTNHPNPDSLRWVLGYNYNKNHFFENIDLSDPRIIRTPILYGKLETYFSRVLIQHPDSLIKEIPKIVSIVESDSSMLRFMVVFLFNHFRESTIMGHDGVTVMIIDDYYLSGKANWISDETFKSLKEDAERLRPNLMGKRSKDLVMDTYYGIPQALHDINKEFTILYFWEPNCGHCKTSTPLLKEFYNKYKDQDIEIFAVCTQGTREDWENYIVENSLDWINGWDPNRTTHFDFYYNVTATPLVYILDRDKTIIAKKLPVENIEGFLTNYKKTNN